MEDIIHKIQENKLSLTQLLKQTKSKVLDLAIHGKLVPQDLNDEPASVLLEKIKNEQKKVGKKVKNISDNSHYPFEIPESWVWCKLGELCNYGKCNNVAPPEISNDAWILDLEDIEKDTGKLLQRVEKRERTTTSTRHSFEAGNVLYSKLRTYLNKVLVADMNGFCTTEILPLDFNGFVIPEYARQVLMSQMFLDYTAKCDYGVKMPRLGTTDGQKALFPLPPFEEQKRIVNHIETIFNTLDSIQNNL
jgi:type I restriction enzyme S subunit